MLLKVFITMLLSLQAIKEKKLKHISVADQNSKSLFPHANRTNLNVDEPLKNVYFKHHSTARQINEEETNSRIKQKIIDLPFAFWFKKKHSLKLNPYKNYVRFY